MVDRISSEQRKALSDGDEIWPTGQSGTWPPLFSDSDPPYHALYASGDTLWDEDLHTGSHGGQDTAWAKIRLQFDSTYVERRARSFSFFTLSTILLQYNPPFTALVRAIIRMTVSLARLTSLWGIYAVCGKGPLVCSAQRETPHD